MWNEIWRNYKIGGLIMEYLGYRIYEHIIGFPSHMDSIVDELEEIFCYHNFTAIQAEEFIKEFVTDTDKYGRKRIIYVYRLTEKEWQNGKI